MLGNEFEFSVNLGLEFRCQLSVFVDFVSFLGTALVIAAGLSYFDLKNRGRGEASV